MGEASGEPQEGRIAVAEVIRNRMQRGYQSDGTLTGTIFRPHAFSTWSTSDPNRRRVAVADDTSPVVIACMEAWSAALQGSALACGAVIYLNLSALGTLPPWAADLKQVAQLGRHTFYADT